MQDLKEKYKFKETSDSISIKPLHERKFRVKIVLMVALVAVTVYVLKPFGYSEASDVLSASTVVLCILSALYDWLFLINMQLVFDKKGRSIYKVLPPFYKKRLMSFDEMEIITTSEYGTWEYAIGRKKKQFLKNYVISQSFSDSKRENEKVLRYHEEILNPILGLMKN